MDIVKETIKLGFPLGSYVVIGSGHIVALGLKNGHDIDILVKKTLFNKCKNEGWEVEKWTYPEMLGKIYLRKGIYELYLEAKIDDYKPTTDGLIQRAVLIGGVPFASLEDILKLKRGYLKNNPKHLKDIKIIERYLASKNSKSR